MGKAEHVLSLMINNPDPFAIDLFRMGPIAARILKQEGKGKVIAVFDNCFYLDLNNTYICLGNFNFSDGPLNVISSAPDKTNWITSGIRVGDRANVANHILSVGLNIWFRFMNTEIWKPRPGLITPILTTKIEQFYASNPSRSGLPKQAYPLIDALSNWLKTSIPLHPPSIEGLLGMGPGLTPSGDDFIGAMLITLHHMGQIETKAQLAKRVIHLTAKCTNPISAQHLYAAIGGMGSDALHRVLADEPSALNALISIGHTSGWDALAGVYTTLKVYYNTNQEGL
jgi:hypothetical protein